LPTPFAAITGYCFIRSIMKGRILRTIIWGIPFGISVVLCNNVYSNLSYIAKEIILLESGK
jgi:hypothetical protein